ncbi:MAG TPA: transcription antitermination protein NusB [Bacteroidales bacterium]|nr:transcription antitermination protein NusB [Bacteroidales bacterium]
MQALYAFTQAGDDRLDVAERSLRKSFDKMYDLYIHLISFILETADFAQQRMEESKNKFFPTEEDLNPNTRFVDNRVIRSISGNPAFRKQYDRLKINWSDERELVRRHWIAFRDSEEMQQYLQSGKDGLENDRNILKVYIRDHMAASDSLRYFYEEQDIHWADDFDTMLGMVLKTVKSFGEAGEDFPPVLIHEDEGVDEMKEFIIPLFRKTIVNGEEYGKLIAQQARNWEFDRIAVLDVILMKMAICELVQFSSIPVKVTINEYIEISKGYSTAKSRVFINGMLDKLLETLKESKMIRKTGRGLLDS